MYRVIAAAAATAFLALSSAGPASATAVTIDLKGSNASGDPLTYSIPSAAFTDNGFLPGTLKVNGTNSNVGEPNSRAVRRADGVGVRSCSGLSCLIESDEVDGLNGRDTLTFSIDSANPNFNFILVGATFRRIDDVGVNLLDDMRLSFLDEDGNTVSNTIDIAAAANAQSALSSYNPCNLFAGDRECHVDFVNLLGGGDPFFMLGHGFSFTALGPLDGWYVSDITWEIGLLRTPTPEPGTLAVLSLALAGAAAMRRRRAA